jgi:hypothetical protein
VRCGVVCLDCGWLKGGMGWVGSGPAYMGTGYLVWVGSMMGSTNPVGVTG